MAYVNLQVSPTNCIGVSLCTEQSVHFSRMSFAASFILSTFMLGESTMTD